MAFSNGIGAEINNNRERFNAVAKLPQPQVQQQAAEQQDVQKSTQQKDSGVAWTGKGDETAVSTRDDMDSLVLSSSFSLTSPLTRPQTVIPSAGIRENLNNWGKALVENIYGSIENLERGKYSHDALQARFGLTNLDSRMNQLFVRLGSAVLASLGEDPAQRIAEIRARVVGELQGENCDKMQSCVDSDVRMNIYG